jgi:hypothetical protein
MTAECMLSGHAIFGIWKFRFGCARFGIWYFGSLASHYLIFGDVQEMVRPY